MLKLVVRRVLEVVFVLFLVTIITFVLTASLGNEAALLCGAGATPQCIARETQFLGLNHPIWAQYFTWLGHFLTGNFGISYVSANTPISSLIKQAYSVTLELMVYSQIIALVLAVPLAMWAALRPNRFFDRFSTTISFASLSAPPFIIGPIMALVFTAEFHIFPGPGTTVPPISDLLSNIRVMFLPSFSLAIGFLAIYQRLLRADMIATLEEDYIVMARAKGLTTARILWRHALRPSTFSLITVAGINVASLITGAIIAESVFGLHGLGTVLTTAIGESDYGTVQIVTVIVAVAYVVLNFLIDFMYA
ncbi:MAG TPA: ABC transporter permease [Acidimicrobiales bacterium]|nr:ABC transporter permease [Acidimicrobiales bacterium]